MQCQLASIAYGICTCACMVSMLMTCLQGAFIGGTNPAIVVGDDLSFKVNRLQNLYTFRTVICLEILCTCTFTCTNICQLFGLSMRQMLSELLPHMVRMLLPRYLINFLQICPYLFDLHGILPSGSCTY